MSDVLTIARSDARIVRRSRLLWGIVAVYVGFVAILFYPAGGGDDVTVAFTVLGATWLTTLLLPLVAIAGSYLAIAGERESNTIRFLLSQPTARRSVVLGKFLSRGLTLAFGLALALLVGLGIVLALYSDPDVGPLSTFAGLSLLLILAFVAISVCVSAAVTTRARAVSATIGYYFVAVVLSVFPGASIESTLRELGGALGLGLEPTLYTLFASLLSPAVAYVNATMLTVPEVAGDLAPADPPAYLSLGAQTGVLVAWIVVPLAVGILVFGRAEIG